MRLSSPARALGLGLIASAALGGFVAAPATADCVEVHAEVRYENGTTWYPLGGPHRCIAPTPWEHMVDLGVEQRFNDPKFGTPNYVQFHVWVPVP